MDSKNSQEKNKRSGLMDLSRKVLLAGIGAAVLAQEEIENFVEKLQEKGEIAEQDARNLIKEMRERKEKIELERNLQEEIDYTKSASKKDLDELTAKVEELTRLVKDLKSQKEKKE